MSETKQNKLSWSEIYGALTCTSNELVDMIHLLWGTKTVPCVVGEAGIGKTQTIKQAAKAYCRQLIKAGKIESEAEFGFVYVVLAHKDREHVTGLYYFDKDGVTFSSMHNKELHAELSKPYGLYFIDEFNRPRDPSLINAVFALISERGANGLYLPDGWSMATAINPASAEYMVAQVERDPAFRRRLCWVEMEYSQAQWASWAKSSGKIHPQVLSFLLDNPERTYDRTLQDKGAIGPTPAGWEDVSEIVWAWEKAASQKGRAIPRSVLRIAIAGKIGQQDASTFMETYQQQAAGEKLPTAMDIVSRYMTDEKIRKFVQARAKKEGIGEDLSKLEAKADKSEGDNKGWLLKTMESVCLTAINADFETILAAHGKSEEEIEALKNETDEGKGIHAQTVALLGYNVAHFMADLPVELFATHTSYWGEVANTSTAAHHRGIDVSMSFSQYKAFQEASRRMRQSSRAAQQ